MYDLAFVEKLGKIGLTKIKSTHYNERIARFISNFIPIHRTYEAHKKKAFLIACSFFFYLFIYFCRTQSLRWSEEGEDEKRAFFLKKYPTFLQIATKTTTNTDLLLLLLLFNYNLLLFLIKEFFF